VEWAIPSRRADQGRDCGAAEIQRIAENASRWSDVNLAAEYDTIFRCRLVAQQEGKLSLHVAAMGAGGREVKATADDHWL